MSCPFVRTPSPCSTLPAACPGVPGRSPSPAAPPQPQPQPLAGKDPCAPQQEQGRAEDPAASRPKKHPYWHRSSKELLAKLFRCPGVQRAVGLGQSCPLKLSFSCQTLPAVSSRTATNAAVRFTRIHGNNWLRGAALKSFIAPQGLESTVATCDLSKRHTRCFLAGFGFLTPRPGRQRRCSSRAPACPGVILHRVSPLRHTPSFHGCSARSGFSKPFSPSAETIPGFEVRSWYVSGHYSQVHPQ